MKGVRLQVTMLVLLAFGCSIAASASAVEELHARVKPLVSAEMPIKIESAAITETEGKPKLTMSVAGVSGQQVNSLTFFMLIFDAEGRTRGGEGWVQKVNLADGSNNSLAWRLRSELRPGDSVVLTIEKVVGQNGAWQLGQTVGAFDAAAKAYLAGQDYSLPEVQFVPAR